MARININEGTLSSLVLNIYENVSDNNFIKVELRIVENRIGGLSSSVIYWDRSYLTVHESRKRFFRFLDNDSVCRFLPRFKYGDHHLSRDKSREIYDTLKECLKTTFEKREENLNKIINGKN